MKIAIAFEDILQERGLEKIFSTCELRFIVSLRLSRNGKGYLEKNTPSFNRAADNGRPTILVTDLDTIECPPSLIKRWLRDEPHQNFIFRVACREIEAWLIADRDSFSSFLGVSKDKLKINPDEIPDPKTYIMTLARRSNNRGIRTDLLPLAHTNASIGPGYNSRLVKYIDDSWNPLAASLRSPSLSRAITAICALHARLMKAADSNAY